MEKQKTAQEKLVDFMRTKASLLPKYKKLYFTKKDAAVVLAWPDKEAGQILYEIKMALENGYYYPSNICVFCAYHKEACDSCEYGVHHGKCNKKDSLYMKLSFTFPRTPFDFIREHAEVLLKCLE